MSDKAVANSVSSKRILVFAHYDKDKIVDDYVIYYLNAFKSVVDKIIFVSDCDLEESEKAKLSGIADEVIAKRHEEYDFGSYKLGFLFALENSLLSDTEELIFANDSCFGPFCPLEKIFEKMNQQSFARLQDSAQKKDLDFWGMTRNENGLVEKKGKYLPCKKLHFQSYFLVFKKQVFLSETFISFIKSVKKQACRKAVIVNYEVGLSEALVSEGFVGKSFINGYENSYNPVLYNWKELLTEQKFPFLKCSLPRLENLKNLVFSGYEKVIQKNSDYSVSLIQNNVKRVSKNKDFLFFFPALIRPFAYKVFFYVQKGFRKIFS